MSLLLSLFGDDIATYLVMAAIGVAGYFLRKFQTPAVPSDVAGIIAKLLAKKKEADSHSTIFDLLARLGPQVQPPQPAIPPDLLAALQQALAAQKQGEQALTLSGVLSALAGQQAATAGVVPTPAK